MAFDEEKYKKQWQKENMSTVIAKYNKGFVDDFKNACKKLGIKQSDAIRNAMNDTIKKAEDRKMKEEKLKIDNFAKICMENTIGDVAKANNEWYLECLEKANDTREFLSLYFSTNNEKVICSQGYGVLLKKQALSYENYNKYYDKVISKADFKASTSSDRGGLKIGNDNFSICVSNGYGDGITKFAVFKKGNPYICAIDHMMEYQIAVDGKFNIYDYDCGDDVIAEIEGSYIIYSYKGYVAFIELNR